VILVLCTITAAETNCLHFIDNSFNPTSMPELQDDYHDEYDDLTKDEKDKLVQEFNDEKDQLKKALRPTARARMQDVTNVVRNIRQLVGLS
jgi:hypothetical protein